MNISDPSFDPNKLTDNQLCILIEKHPSLVSILENKTINCLDLSLSNVKFIPSGLKIKTDLTLDDCTKLEFISPDLIVGRDLYVRNCPGLKHSNLDQLNIGGKITIGPPGYRLAGYHYIKITHKSGRPPNLWTHILKRGKTMRNILLIALFQFAAMANEIIPLPTPQPTTISKIQIASTLIQAKEARETYRVDGKGYTVAIIDTGVRTTHLDFKDRILTQINYTTDNNSNTQDATDGHGHGTHITGIIAANHTTIGIAPQANIIPIKALSNSRYGKFEDLERALAWIIDNHTAYNITAVNISFGNTQNLTHVPNNLLKQQIQKHVQTLRNKKIATTAAAGNDYFHYQEQGMIFPAIISQIISVSATYSSKAGDYEYVSGAHAYSSTAGQIIPFAQRLHKSTNSKNYTNIFAPGNIKSTGRLSDDAVSNMHGTSASTAIITGAILLMQQHYYNQHGELPTVDLIEQTLYQTGTTIHDGDDEDDNVQHTNQDYKQVNIKQALQQLTIDRPPQIESPLTITPQTARIYIPRQFSISVYEPEHQSLQYHWDFGDGVTQTTSNPHTTYKYTVPGKYTTILTITDGTHNVTTQQTTTVTYDINIQKIKLKINHRTQKNQAHIKALIIPKPKESTITVSIGSVQQTYQDKKSKYTIYGEGTHWDTLGLTNTTTTKQVTIPLIITINDIQHAFNHNLTYISKEGKSGRTK